MSTALFNMDDLVHAGGFTGNVCGIFPPEDEIEILVWIAERTKCWDGTHVAGCWGTVEHEHAGRYERMTFPADKVKQVAEPVA